MAVCYTRNVVPSGLTCNLIQTQRNNTTQAIPLPIDNYNTTVRCSSYPQKVRPDWQTDNPRHDKAGLSNHVPWWRVCSGHSPYTPNYTKGKTGFANGGTYTRHLFRPKHVTIQGFSALGTQYRRGHVNTWMSPCGSVPIHPRLAPARAKRNHSNDQQNPVLMLDFSSAPICAFHSPSDPPRLKCSDMPRESAALF